MPTVIYDFLPLQYIYKDQVLGKLSKEWFQKLSYKYEDEQAELEQRIKHLKMAVREEKAHEMNANGFLQMVRKYTDIDKIVVHHREQLFGKTVHRVETYYKMIRYVNLPELDGESKECYRSSFGRNGENRIAI